MHYALKCNSIIHGRFIDLTNTCLQSVTKGKRVSARATTDMFTIGTNLWFAILT